MSTRPDELEVANRRYQLRRWLDVFFNGSQAEFIASTNDGKTQLNSGELSLLLKNKSFGQKRARSLELAAHMPHGYLDSVALPGDPVTESKLSRAVGMSASQTQTRNPAAKWPFETIDAEKIARLDSKTLGRLEGAILGIASQLAIDIAAHRVGGRSSMSNGRENTQKAA